MGRNNPIAYFRTELLRMCFIYNNMRGVAIWKNIIFRRRRRKYTRQGKVKGWPLNFTTQSLGVLGAILISRKIRFPRRGRAAPFKHECQSWRPRLRSIGFRIAKPISYPNRNVGKYLLYSDRPVICEALPILRTLVAYRLGIPPLTRIWVFDSV